MSARRVKKHSTETKSKPTISHQSSLSPVGIVLTDIYHVCTVTGKVIKSSANQTTKKKPRGKIVKEEQTKRKVRIEMMLQSLEKDELHERVTKLLVEALKTNWAVAEQYSAPFVRLDENTLLDIVTKCATIRKEIRESVINGLNEAMEKYNE